jgi:hypothetical protein
MDHQQIIKNKEKTPSNLCPLLTSQVNGERRGRKKVVAGGS